MDRKINFNIQASSYVPKTHRQAEPEKRNYDNSGTEVIYNYQGGKGNHNYNNYPDQTNYNDYYSSNQGQNYYNQNVDYQYDNKFNKEKKGKNQNYTEYSDYDNKNYYQNQKSYKKGGHNQYYNQNDQGYDNSYQGQSHYNESDNYNKGGKNMGRGGKFQGYQGQDYTYEQNNNKEYGIVSNQIQTSKTQTSKPKQEEFMEVIQVPDTKSGYNSHSNFNKHSKSAKYNQNYQYEQNTQYNKSKGKGSYGSHNQNQKFKVVEKDVTDNMRVNYQDLEDDIFDEETYGGDLTYSELTGEDYQEDDLYEDYAGDNYGFDNFEDDLGDDFYSVNDKFSNMKVSDKEKGVSSYQTQGNQYSQNSKYSNSTKNEGTSSSTGSLKHRLIFSNKEGFTNYVEELIRQEKKNSGVLPDGSVNILMIAEKPSIAKAISEAIGGKVNMRKMGKGGCIFNFAGYFGNVHARFTVSSVMGHVYTSDFQKEHNNWNSIDYLDLYDAPVAKLDANIKTRIPGTLERLAQGKDILCLWLDCDKEGENICYEVIYNTYPHMNKRHYQQIYRAKFSSLTKQDLKTAFNRLKDPPNKYESLSVDARQVIDLKIGVSFTRFLTSAILPGIKGTDTKFLSYGPCQTPTLWFCVNRLREINSFKSKEYFKVFTEIEINKIKYRVPYHHKFYDKNELKNFLEPIKEAKNAKVVNVRTVKHKKDPPVGLNTVQMLRVASSYLKMSPHETMHVAEKLYTMGYITYPRTETTKYASSFDLGKAIGDFSNHPTFGKQIQSMLKNYRKPVLRGVDVGDHPPITPSRVATAQDLKGGDHWRLYEFICTNFFASASEPTEYEEKVIEIDVNGQVFEAESILITKEGFLGFMPWKRHNYIKDFPVLKQDTVLSILQITTESHWTEPPEYLSESDLIKMMEQNKIGTDASMAVHIQNICERQYVKADSNRRLIPTKLGKALIESLSAVDPEIVQPSVRAEIENYVHQVAQGNKKFEDVLTYAMDLYKKKFLYVRQHYEKLLNSFKKYFEIDLMEMNKVYMNIKSKNEALKIMNMKQKR